MTPEKNVQTKILNYLNQLEKDGQPIFFQKRQAGGFNYKKGIPDIYVVVNGIHIEVEVKKPGGQLSAMQEKFRDKCQKLNICWTVVDNVDIFIQYINNFL